MRRLLIFVVVILALLGVGYYFASAPSIPRATLEANYATPPSQFVDLSYASTLPPGSDPRAGRRTGALASARLQCLALHLGAMV